MALHQSDIQELRNRLQLSRWQIHDTFHQVEEQLNVPRRIKSEVAQHPVKWLALALGAGVVATKTLPLLMRAAQNRWLRQFITAGVRMAAVSALPLLAHARASRLLDARV